MAQTAAKIEPLPGSYVLAIDTRTQAGRDAVRGMVKGLCAGAVQPMGLEDSARLAVSMCGPEFGAFLAERYGQRVPVLGSLIAELQREGK